LRIVRSLIPEPSKAVRQEFLMKPFEIVRANLVAYDDHNEFGRCGVGRKDRPWAQQKYKEKQLSNSHADILEKIKQQLQEIAGKRG
jgi:hypothetical protein